MRMHWPRWVQQLAGLLLIAMLVVGALLECAEYVGGM